MEPETRLSLALVVSLLVWLPSLGALLRGDTSVERALVWYAVGLVLAWLAIGGVGHLFASYNRDTADRATASGADVAPTRGPASDDADAGPSLDVSGVPTDGFDHEAPTEQMPGNVAAGA